jgi:hypothetical protein
LKGPATNAARAAKSRFLIRCDCVIIKKIKGNMKGK